MNVQLFVESLSILLQGMAGVFIVMILLALTITVLNRVGRGRKKKDNGWF